MLKLSSLQMHDQMWQHMNDFFFRHAATSNTKPGLCGRFIMYDGNAKVRGRFWGWYIIRTKVCSLVFVLHIVLAT
jgi:hypothetical protein